MTERNSTDGQVVTADEFERALERFLLAASENDIDPTGAWECRNDDGPSDWEVMVLELEKREQ